MTEKDLKQLQHPQGERFRLLGQLSRSGTSVGASYRSACRSRFTADMIFAKRGLESKIANPKSKIR